MGILKKKNPNLYIAFLGTWLLGCSFNVSFGQSKASQLLVGSYQIDSRLDKTDVENIISELKQALNNCHERHLSCRIKYRIGVLYFKAGLLEEALNHFLKISEFLDCPLFVRACGLNMAGQIYRLRGHYNEALSVFEKLKKLIEVNPCKNDKALKKLKYPAMFAKAEMYQILQRPALAQVEYEKLIETLEQGVDENFREYLPIAKDRLSQLYLLQGAFEKYFETAEALTHEFPNYFRTGIIQFELESVKFLKVANNDKKYSSGSFSAPVELIREIQDKKDNVESKLIADKLAKLSEEHIHTFSGVILNYHYAWLLDVIGQKERSIDIFSQLVTQNKNIDESDAQIGLVIETVSKYAAFQTSIMLGESGDYDQALEVLSDLPFDDNENHMSKLSKSIQKSLTTIKKEKVQK
jgi:tetratricopeptide (TPR) repeat protein